MGAGSGSLVLATVVLWGVLATRAQRADLSTPFLFVAAGVVYTEVFDVLHLEVEHELVKVVAEVTLVWVLFADATRVRPRQLRSELGLYVRLLGLGLPLTVGLGTVVAIVLLGLDPWAALLVAAALAPTDAALGAAVMSDRSVPVRIRGVLNVESGLNDGIVTPVVLVAVAGVAAQEGIEGVEAPGRAVVDLGIGVVVGVVIGVAGGALVRVARRRGWLHQETAGPAVLALALLAYTGAVLVEGNGFVAAFVCGLLFGQWAGRRAEAEIAFVEQVGGLASVISWLIFGAVVVPNVAEELDWQLVLYAALSLTLIRMLPVAVSLSGTGLNRASIAFIGWFGPRGLASIVFALLALEGLHGAVDRVVATIGLTVLLSVVCHGFSAAPLARRYGRTHSMAGSGAAPTDEPAVRRLSGRR